jgi:membrane protease subunit HflK
MTIDALLTDGKDNFSSDVLAEAQRTLDMLECGITITNYEINVIAPPSEVKEMFDKVNAANVESKTLIAQAEQHREIIIPQAKSDASSLYSNAMIDQSTRVSATQEKMAEFYGLLEEYEKQPAVVIERVYAQKLKEIYKKLGNIIFVDENTPNIIIK